MINVILTFNQTKEFTEEAQQAINKIQFSKIPEMRIVNDAIPYQANVENEQQFTELKTVLESFGQVDIIGKWNNDGSKIECDINKYRDALNNIETFEKAEILGMVEDEDGKETEVVVKTFTRVKSSKRPTLSEARNIQVNVFNNKFIREI